MWNAHHTLKYLENFRAVTDLSMLKSCPICLGDIGDGEKIFIDNCHVGHAFHLECAATLVTDAISKYEKNFVQGNYPTFPVIKCPLSREDWDPYSLSQIKPVSITVDDKNVNYVVPPKNSLFSFDKNDKRLVKIKALNGTSAHFVGRVDKERLIKIEHIGGNVLLYKGPRKKERRIQEIFPNGEVIYYTGERDKERAVKKVLPTGEEISL